MYFTLNKPFISPQKLSIRKMCRLARDDFCGRGRAGRGAMLTVYCNVAYEASAIFSLPNSNTNLPRVRSNLVQALPIPWVLRSWLVRRIIANS